MSSVVTQSCEFSMQAPPILDQEFLPLRAKLLEIAAAMDRLDRTESWDADETRTMRIREAIQALQKATSDRAEQIQLVFSRPYEDDWREKLQITNDE
jgi:hypothetical protein